jgi:hypothetical protein
LWSQTLKAKKTQEVHRRASLATSTLERAWAELRGVIPGLPEAVIIPIDAGGRHRRLGHFAPETWRAHGRHQAHEIALSPHLFSSSKDLLATMVHEAVHALLDENDPDGPYPGGVSADRYYHRHAFRDRCLELGLACGLLNRRYGWSLTQWPAGKVPGRYRPVLEVLSKLPYGSGRGALRRRKGKPLPPSGQVRLHCSCVPVRTVYVAKSQVGKGAIVCTSCAASFS